MIRLRPCPVNALQPPDDQTFCWPLFPGIARTDGSAARRRWQIDAATRLAMMAWAPWAVSAAAHSGRSSHYDALLIRIVDALVAADVPVELLVVCPEERPPIEAHRARVRITRYLAPDIYDELLIGSDVVLTDNIIQTSASKAFAAAIPTLVLIDSRPPAPWNIFPLGLRFDVDAPYAHAVAPVELTDSVTLRARVAAALSGLPHDDADYRRALTRLPTPAEILARQ